MRLFIAVNFDEQIKKSLTDCMEKLKDASIRGNFTLRDNLHLTLVFIGETSKINEVRRAMDMISAAPFDLAIGGFGRFKKSGGDICWLGFGRNTALEVIYNELYESLTKAGFKLESREFKPHLTLGREITLNNGFDEGAFARSTPPMDVHVAQISLMKSERINGRLTYGEIYSRQLGKAE